MPKVGAFAPVVLPAGGAKALVREDVRGGLSFDRGGDQPANDGG